MFKNKRARMPEKAGCVGIKKALNLKSRNKKLNRETAKKRTNKQTELDQFRKEPRYDGDLSPH